MEPVLFEAIAAGDIAEVTRLVREDPARLHARDASGASVLLAAAYRMKADVVSTLVDLGAPIDLFEAAVLGRVDRIADILRTSPERASEYAPDGFTPVALAAFFGQSASATTLIAAGADVNAAARNPLKVTALHAAVAGRRLDIVAAVLAAGADANAQQQAGFRPIHEAANQSNTLLAELLLAHGADPTLPDDSGKSAIDVARDKGHAEFAEWLAAQRPAMR